MYHHSPRRHKPEGVTDRPRVTARPISSPQTDRRTMPDLTSVLRRLAIALVGITATATAAAGAAQVSTSLGELAHFGGQEGPGAGLFETIEGTAAIGVNQENNSVFVVDLPDTNGEFRIQKFEYVSGHYKAVASTIFTPPTKEEPEDPGGM